MNIGFATDPGRSPWWLPLLKRVIMTAFLLIGLVTIMFVIAHVAPGDPVSAIITPTMSPAVAEELRHQFGIDKPILVQYGEWMSNAFNGNLGISFSHRRPVALVIADVFPNTALLASCAIGLEMVLGIILGMLAAAKENSFLDRLISNLGLVVYTLPTFWVGLVLVAVFSYGLGIFPSSQMHSMDAGSMSTMNRSIDLLRHLMLPVLTIAIPGAGGIARYVRSSLAKVKREEYILFARSLKINRQKIFFFYELLNALGPVITILGLEIGTLLAGALVTETIFAWPGMGRLAVLAILSRDYPLVMGCTVISGVVVVFGNLISDVLYRRIDPRVRAAL